MTGTGHALVSLHGVVVARSLSVGLAFTLAQGVPDTNGVAAFCESDKTGLVVVVRVVCFSQGGVSDRREHDGYRAGSVAGQVEIDRDEKAGLALQQDFLDGIGFALEAARTTGVEWGPGRPRTEDLTPFGPDLVLVIPQALKRINLTSQRLVAGELNLLPLCQ